MKRLPGPTRIARSGNPGALTAALLDLLLAHEPEYLENPRELMLTLAPYHHCARWLGEDPGEVFDTVAAGAPATLRDAVRTFGRRDDIEPEYLENPRELMLMLAPYHHCARWLGEDPGEVFDTVAAGAPATLRDAVRTFGRRDDIEPEAFGFAIVQTAEGAEYFRVV